jgi:hypothetical protein
MWCNQLVKPLARFLLGATREAVYALRDGMTGADENYGGRGREMSIDHVFGRRRMYHL